MRLFNTIRPYIGIKTILTAMAITTGLYFAGMVAGISVGVALLGIFGVGRLIARLRRPSETAAKQLEALNIGGNISSDIMKNFQNTASQIIAELNKAERESLYFAIRQMQVQQLMIMNRQPLVYGVGPRCLNTTHANSGVSVIDENNNPVVSDDELPELVVDEGPAL